MCLFGIIMKYRENDYFNKTDYFLIKTNYNKYYVTKCHWYNGAWYSDVSLKYKMSSVLSVSCAELVGKPVVFRGTSLKGKISSNFLSPDSIGVDWNQGENYRRYSLPNYWNIIENLEL